MANEEKSKEQLYIELSDAHDYIRRLEKRKE